MLTDQRLDLRLVSVRQHGQQPQAHGVTVRIRTAVQRAHTSAHRESQCKG